MIQTQEANIHVNSFKEMQGAALVGLQNRSHSPNFTSHRIASVIIPFSFTDEIEWWCKSQIFAFLLLINILTKLRENTLSSETSLYCVAT